MQVISFQKYLESFHPAYPKGPVECPRCDGAGRVTSTRTKKVIQCRYCKARGYVGSKRLDYDARIEVYRAHVAEDVRRFCSWTGRDYLEEIAVVFSGLNQPNQTNQPTRG